MLISINISDYGINQTERYSLLIFRYLWYNLLMVLRHTVENITTDTIRPQPSAPETDLQIETRTDIRAMISFVIIFCTLIATGDTHSINSHTINAVEINKKVSEAVMRDIEAIDTDLIKALLTVIAPVVIPGLAAMAARAGFDASSVDSLALFTQTVSHSGSSRDQAPRARGRDLNRARRARERRHKQRGKSKI
jgi:hypothetical protein